MTNTFTTTGGASHSRTVTGLTNGTTYSFFVRCQDSAGNANTNDFTISFLVAQPSGGGVGLVAAYSFNEGNGASITDASGNGHTGTISGAIWSSEGKFGNTLSFDGVNDRVTIPSSSLLNLTTGMTLETWVYPTTATNYRAIAVKLSGVDSVYWFGVSPGPKASIFLAPSGAPEVALHSATLPLNTWSHISFTYNTGTLRLYLNGLLAGTITTASSLPASSDPLMVGGDPWGQYFQGRIDELRIYSRALTQTEIQTDMNKSIGP
jgi:hypothetical protein